MTRPLKGLYELKWRYGTWKIVYERKNQKFPPPYNNEKIEYLFHGHGDGRDAILKKLDKIHATRAGWRRTSVEKISGV